MLQREGLVIATPNQRGADRDPDKPRTLRIAIARLALEVVAIRITVPTLDLDRHRCA